MLSPLLSPLTWTGLMITVHPLHNALLCELEHGNYCSHCHFHHNSHHNCHHSCHHHYYSHSFHNSLLSELECVDRHEVGVLVHVLPEPAWNFLEITIIIMKSKETFIDNPKSSSSPLLPPWWTAHCRQWGTRGVEVYILRKHIVYVISAQTSGGISISYVVVSEYHIYGNISMSYVVISAYRMWWYQERYCMQNSTLPTIRNTQSDKQLSSSCILNILVAAFQT